MLQDDSIAMMAQQAAASSQAGKAGEALVTDGMKAADSTMQALGDTMQKMDITDVKGIVTGENTILKDALSSITDLTIAFVPKLIGAILILWIGWKLIKVLKRAIVRLLDKRGAEASLKSFLSSFVDVLMKVLLVIMAMDVIGIKATSFIAILGAAGLAVGMALQGTLQNFAGGVIILLMRPFKVGDYIECGNYKGYVKEIKIFHTIIRPFNGRIIIVPNASLSNSSLINHTKDPVIRLDVTASVAYGTDLKKAKEVLYDIIRSDSRILGTGAEKPVVVSKDNKPNEGTNAEEVADTKKKAKQADEAPKFKSNIVVTNLGDSSVDFTMWLWTSVEDYWGVYIDIRENIYNRFHEEGIAIPFPQMDVHLDR